MINKDLCSRKAGVEIPPPDWSYDDLLEISRKLTNEEENKWGLVIYQNYVFYMMGTWMYNFGGQILNETKDRALYGTDPASLEGAQFNIDPGAGAQSGSRPVQRIWESSFQRAPII